MPGLLPPSGNNGKRKYRRMFGVLNPARIVGEPTMQRVEGRLTQAVSVITEITTREGDRTYLTEDVIPTRYLIGEIVNGIEMDQRMVRNEALDGPENTELKPIAVLVQEVRASEDAYQQTTRGTGAASTNDILAKIAALQQR
jgi:hypothetical protein